MNNNIKVSVIVPAYNSEKFISKCLDSVLSQTYKNFELIVVDDGSIDATGSIIEKYKKQNPDIINFIKQENIGVANTRNKVIKLAKGDYIAFIDNDDFIDNDYLETLVNNCEDGKYDIVLSGYRRPNEKGKVIFEKRISDYEFSKLVVQAPWAKIYKTKYILENDFKFLDNNIGEDIFFNLSTILSTNNVKILNYIGYNWFYNSESVSNSKQKDFDKIDVFRLLNSCYDDLSKRNLLQNNYEILEFFFYRYIVWFLTFASKGHSLKEIKIENKKLFSWIKDKFPEYKKNKLVRFNKPKGEEKKNQIINKTFMIFHKIKLDNLLIWVYSKIK